MPASERSMIASRRKPSATPSAAYEPSPSGPRWSSSAAIRATVSASGGRPSATIPQIPHMPRMIAAAGSGIVKVPGFVGGLPRDDDVGRSRSLREVKEPLASRLLFPLVERRFTYGEYARFLG